MIYLLYNKTISQQYSCFALSLMEFIRFMELQGIGDEQQ